LPHWLEHLGSSEEKKTTKEERGDHQLTIRGKRRTENKLAHASSRKGFKKGKGKKYLFRIKGRRGTGEEIAILEKTKEVSPKRESEKKDGRG